MNWQLEHGDCVEVMRALDADSIDAVVTDPPYGLEFMGKEWDDLGKSGVQRKAEVGGGDRRAVVDAEKWAGGESSPYSRSRVRWQHGAAGPAAMQEWHHAWATEALRVLKPGGHLLAFGGTRTYHRLACAVEDAGFEIRDSLIWLYGSGFPKSLDVGKAMDKAAGAEREVVGEQTYADGAPPRVRAGTDLGVMNDDGWEPGSVRERTAPATPEAEKWNGWGTALKPGHEPIVMARKPLIGTVAANVQAHGTGALHVDACRIDAPGGSPAAARRQQSAGHCRPGEYGEDEGRFVSRTSPERYAEERPGEAAGRWPANVVLDEAAAAELDRQSGELVTHSTGRNAPSDYANAGMFGVEGSAKAYNGDIGGASRFFYCAKASRGERNAGLDGFEERAFAQSGGGQTDVESGDERYAGSLGLNRVKRVRNPHPTVKPIDLMRWLCRLVTPPGGTVLDPFTGSGTTGIAAVLEGVDFIGIEREADYIDIARARIGWWAAHPAGPPEPPPAPLPGQLSLEAS